MAGPAELLVAALLALCAPHCCLGNPDAKRLYDDPHEQLQPAHPTREQQLGPAHRAHGAQALPTHRCEPKEPDYDNQRMGQPGDHHDESHIHEDGRVGVEPAGHLQELCQIDVQYFPFDKQDCFMKFGSWTYDGFQVDLKHVSEIPDNKHRAGGHRPDRVLPERRVGHHGRAGHAAREVYSCCEQPYPDITFNITLRRKTLLLPPSTSSSPASASPAYPSWSSTCLQIPAKRFPPITSFTFHRK
ncbi:hypothetical protein HPB51_009190 [Rhipicephalus microplus]|uniref:Neurotransmitter-gated ion-channel ligand-binding domain-containing protein n=1 Tax=Rhipicephalus microplus TaxID=6941 RepID=A0A9J6EZI7_RHIMP|nr:hypothetical protein HPB51_009190 [Rhipicephalus microplus]